MKWFIKTNNRCVSIIWKGSSYFVSSSEKGISFVVSSVGYRYLISVHVVETYVIYSCAIKRLENSEK